jgi:hypothetical protein
MWTQSRCRCGTVPVQIWAQSRGADVRQPGRPDGVAPTSEAPSSVVLESRCLHEKLHCDMCAAVHGIMPKEPITSRPQAAHDMAKAAEEARAKQCMPCYHAKGRGHMTSCGGRGWRRCPSAVVAVDRTLCCAQLRTARHHAAYLLCARTTGVCWILRVTARPRPGLRMERHTFGHSAGQWQRTLWRTTLNTPRSSAC